MMNSSSLSEAVLPGKWESPSLASGHCATELQDAKLRFDGCRLIDMVLRRVGLDAEARPTAPAAYDVQAHHPAGHLHAQLQQLQQAQQHFGTSTHQQRLNSIYLRELPAGAHYYFQLFYAQRCFSQERPDVVALACVLLISKVFDETRRLDPVLNSFVPMSSIPNFGGLGGGSGGSGHSCATSGSTGSRTTSSSSSSTNLLAMKCQQELEQQLLREDPLASKEMLRSQVIKCESLLIRALQFDFDPPTKVAFDFLDRLCRKIPEVYKATLATTTTTGGGINGAGGSGHGHGLQQLGGASVASSSSSTSSSMMNGIAGQGGQPPIPGQQQHHNFPPFVGSAGRKRTRVDSNDDIDFAANARVRKMPRGGGRGSGPLTPSSATSMTGAGVNYSAAQQHQHLAGGSGLGGRGGVGFPQRQGTSSSTRGDLPPSVVQEVRQKAQSLLYDCYRSSMVLKYSPRVLALTCLKFALKVISKRLSLPVLAKIDLPALDHRVLHLSRTSTLLQRIGGGAGRAAMNKEQDEETYRKVADMTIELQQMLKIAASVGAAAPQPKVGGQTQMISSRTTPLPTPSPPD
ncbi:unnamed protein product [Amoebophrya sp. A25]|nr:unnamed protein product [Amoebophrya sp. A25]|eukprot:GSA25T00003063001.1